MDMPLSRKLVANEAGELGYYVPGFFEIFVATDKEDMSLTNFDDKELGTFFHEYIHFLQDITTFYGLNNIYAFTEYLHFGVNQCYKNEDKQISVPIIIGNNSVVPAILEINKLTYGDVSDLKRFDISNISTFKDLVNSKCNVREIDGYVIETTDDNLVSFGAGAIMESMAYLMERFCIENPAKSSLYPYCSAEIVAQYLSPRFCSDPYNVLALCDASLMCSNPGRTFIDYIKSYEKNCPRNIKPENIYHHIFSMKLQNIDGSPVPVIDSLQQIAQLARNQLKDYIKDDSDEFKKLNQWIDSIIDFTIDFRSNHPSLIVDMARNGFLLKNRVFSNILQQIGTPTLRNLNFDYQQYPGKRDCEESIAYIKAVHCMYRLLHDGELKCDLYEWCSKDVNISVDESCINKPWLKCNKDLLCPFGYLWKHWGLSKYHVKLQ